MPAGEADPRHQLLARQSVRGASAVHTARRPIRTLGFKVCVIQRWFNSRRRRVANNGIERTGRVNSEVGYDLRFWTLTLRTPPNKRSGRLR